VLVTLGAGLEAEQKVEALREGHALAEVGGTTSA
jgi:hypothetical protein